jgi:hypothetical protein
LRSSLAQNNLGVRQMQEQALAVAGIEVIGREGHRLGVAQAMLDPTTDARFGRTRVRLSQHGGVLIQAHDVACRTNQLSERDRIGARPATDIENPTARGNV